MKGDTNFRLRAVSLAVVLMSGAFASGTLYAQVSSTPSSDAPASTRPEPVDRTPRGYTGPVDPSNPMVRPGNPPAVSPANPSMATNPATRAGNVPTRQELASSAFGKLDVNAHGYVTRADVAQLEGFDSAFAQADTNGDGRLTRDEFNRAWQIYANQTR